MVEPRQTVLVTGASGFVGQALVPYLKERGYNVRTLARSRADFNFDLAQKPDLRRALEGCQAVVHLASRVHVMDETETNPLRAYRQVNVEATRHLAEQAIEVGVTHFVFMSSIKVNGEKTGARAFSEKISPAPEDPYGLSKLEAEQILQQLAHQIPAFKVVSLRPPLVYGPGVKANFQQLAGLVRRLPLLPFGLLRERRSLIFVGNLVSAVEASLRSPISGSFVVSDGRSVGVGELCRAMAHAMNRRLVMIPIPIFFLKFLGAVTGQGARISRLTDALEVDSTGFEEALRWKPPYSLEEGLKMTLAEQR